MHGIRNKLKNALIFGLTGQDGAYLSNFLLKKDTMFLELLEELVTSVSKD